MRRVILAILVVFLLWLSGFAYYIYLVRSYVIDARTATNAIVVFTGSRQRIETGVSLLKAGYAPILFITGLESQNQLQNFLIEHNVKLDQVIYALGSGVKNDNAREAVEFILTHNLTSIRLVTSAYDMPLALEALTKLIPSAYRVYIIPHPIFSEYKLYVNMFIAYHQYIATIISEIFQ